jgi:hypothetical protein
MLRVLTPLLIIISLVVYSTYLSKTVDPVPGYPIWMQDSTGHYTNQTSGICIVSDSNNIKNFVIADDMGIIRRVIVNENLTPPSIKIDSIHLSNNAYNFLENFRKKDFEEIFLRKSDDKLLISIEGYVNDSSKHNDFKTYEGVFELETNGNLKTCDTITGIKRITIPAEVFEFSRVNVAIEGMTKSPNYYFMGLENAMVSDIIFSDSTYIYILDDDLKLLKKINTHDMGIMTICGLYAVNDYELYGIDRNQKKMFYIKFNPDFSINDYDVANLNLPVPGYPDMNKIMGFSPESITFDNEGSIYVALDPWKEVYNPDVFDKKKLTQKDLEYFENKVPVLYKFKNPFK